jgi:hypothetical protein
VKRSVLLFSSVLAAAFAVDPPQPKQELPPLLLTLVLKTTAGVPVGNAKAHVRQYTTGNDQPPSPPLDEDLTSDLAGCVAISTTEKRKVVAEFRVPGFRPVRFEIDRPYKPRFPEGKIDFTWATRPDSKMMDTGEIFSQLPRDNPLVVTVFLPGPSDDDRIYLSLVRASLPPEKKP